MSDDNVVYLKHRVTRTEDPVPHVCELASEVFQNLIILGTNKEGQVQMITTVQDPAELLWYFEAARFGLMLGGDDD